jgi:hydroxyethylthiazole kinase-like sugar kinase family protein
MKTFETCENCRHFRSTCGAEIDSVKVTNQSLFFGPGHKLMKDVIVSGCSLRGFGPACPCLRGSLVTGMYHTSMFYSFSVKQALAQNPRWRGHLGFCIPDCNARTDRD